MKLCFIIFIGFLFDKVAVFAVFEYHPEGVILNCLGICFASYIMHANDVITEWIN